MAKSMKASSGTDVRLLSRKLYFRLLLPDCHFKQQITDMAVNGSRIILTRVAPTVIEIQKKHRQLQFEQKSA